MFNSQVLEVATGLVFVFLIASMLATTIRELLEGWLKTRAIHLERGIRQLLDDPDGTAATKAIFDHPQLYGLFDGVYDPKKLTAFRRSGVVIGQRRHTEVERDGAFGNDEAKRLPLFSRFPAYIPSRNFAVALLDLIGAGGGDQRASSADLMETLRANAMALRPGRVRDALLVALAEAGDDFDRARISLEAWFDAGMDRVSGWYKRETQVFLILIGLATAVLFNIDAVRVTRELATNNSVRQQVLLQASGVHRTLVERSEAEGSLQLDKAALETARAGLGDLIGWEERPFELSFSGVWRALLILLGWTITAIAISLGAPFWFDVLNKFMVIRSTVKPYEKSPAEGSEDRKGAKTAAERLEQPSSGAPVAKPTDAPEEAEGPETGHVRLAVDMTGLSGASLKVNGKERTLPTDGFLELSLVMGVPNNLSVHAVDEGGAGVVWEESVVLSREDDLLPLAASLARAAS